MKNPWGSSIILRKIFVFATKFKILLKKKNKIKLKSKNENVFQKEELRFGLLEFRRKFYIMFTIYSVAESFRILNDRSFLDAINEPHLSVVSQSD